MRAQCPSTSRGLLQRSSQRARQSARGVSLAYTPLKHMPDTKLPPRTCTPWLSQGDAGLRQARPGRARGGRALAKRISMYSRGTRTWSKLSCAAPDTVS